MVGLYKHTLNVVMALIRNCIKKFVSDAITLLYLNFTKLENNCLHGFYLDVVTYPCPNLHAKLNVVVTKRAPIVRTNSEHHRW